MTDASAPAWIAAGAASAVAIVSAIVAYVRGATRNDEQISALRADLADLKTTRTREHLSIKEDVESVGRQVGETMQAVRQKVSDTEIWNRDNFVRRSDFISTVEGLNRNLDILRASMETSMARVIDKIDKLKESLEEKIDSIRTPNK